MQAAGMHYYERGSGEVAVIFLHYFGGSGESWNGVMDALAPFVRCLAPDLRGFGLSEKSAETLSVDENADDVLRLVEALGLRRYVLVGHSMGGKIALAVAARRPQGLESLVLVAPSPPAPEPMDDAAREELFAMYGDAEKIAAHLQNICAKPLPEEVLAREVAHHLRVSRTAWDGWIAQGTREDISGRVGDIEVPVLVLGGDMDTAFTEALLRREVVARLMGAQLEMVADVGHLIPLEKTQLLATRIERWLRLP